MNEKIESIKSFLSSMVAGIVTYPDEVELHIKDITGDNDEPLTSINIKVAMADIPKCIGSQGSIADSLRRLVVMHSRNIEYDRKILLRVDAPELPRNHFKYKK